MDSQGTNSGDFKETAKAALQFAGVSVTDSDLEMVLLVARALAPGMRALDESDLARIAFEAVIDPGQAPSPLPNP